MRKKNDPSADPNAPRPFGVPYVPQKKKITPDSNRVFAAHVSEIPAGKSKQIHLPNATVAIFNVDGKFHAVKDACPHADYPLYKGTLKGTIVQCANHNWQFDLRDGKCHKGDPDVVLKTYDLDVRGDEIWLKL